jgi:hypothetical protein
MCTFRVIFSKPLPKQGIIAHKGFGLQSAGILLVCSACCVAIFGNLYPRRAWDVDPQLRMGDYGTIFVLCTHSSQHRVAVTH